MIVYLEYHHMVDYHDPSNSKVFIQSFSTMDKAIEYMKKDYMDVKQEIQEQNHEITGDFEFDENYEINVCTIPGNTNKNIFDVIHYFRCVKKTVDYR